MMAPLSCGDGKRHPSYYDGEYHTQELGGQLLTDYSLPARVAFFQQHCCAPGCAVLDFGCGTGGILSSLKSIREQDSLGVDVSQTAISVAKATFPSLRWERVAIGEPLPAHSPFDVVVASEVIEHAFDADAFLQQLRAALKPGGTLGLSCPFHGFWKDLAIVLLGKAESHFHNPDDPHIRFYSVKALRTVLERNGFSLELTRPICPYLGMPFLARMVGVKAIKR